jgi:CRISPR-associated protein Cmx8
MAKKTNSPPMTISVTYDLNDLPTAQHKAGLAGLLLQIDHLRGRGQLAPEYEFDEQCPDTKVTIHWTKAATDSIFDAIYDAEIIRVPVKKKWNGATAIAEEEVEETVDGKTKKVKVFVYEVVQPKGTFLQQYIINSPDSWMKLWRDMLWNIPRGNPQSRQPFEERANGTTCKEGPAAWSDLQKIEKARLKGLCVTDSVAGSLWLGAQANNAECITFDGRLDQTLLLHFWCLTTLIFVPQVISIHGESEFTGYALAIPEVCSLPVFMNTYRRLLTQLPGDTRDFRPARAVIDVAAQGALEYAESLTRLVQEDVRKTSVRKAINSLEFFHMAKIGNNVKTLASGRIVPRDELLRKYEFIVGKSGEKPPFGNPLFRRGLILALLNGIPWFRPFGRLFAEWPHHFFVQTDKSPSRLSWFWSDAREKLSQEFENMNQSPDELPSDPQAMLIKLVHRLVRNYVTERAKARSGIDPEKFKAGDRIDWDALPKAFYDERKKVGESLFLEFRSRRDQAFIDHFAQTLFSSKQYLSEEQLTTLGHALLKQTDDVKTITLMSLSANS